jgi:hypothetical protein
VNYKSLFLFDNEKGKIIFSKERIRMMKGGVRGVEDEEVSR